MRHQGLLDTPARERNRKRYNGEQQNAGCSRGDAAMDDQSLRTVVEVAKQGSLTKAAQALHISSQGLKNRLDAIEAELDCSLFVRSAKGCVLTAKGQTFVEKAPKLLREIEDFVGEVKYSGSAVRIAFWPNRGNRFQDAINYRFSQRFPHIKSIFVPIDASNMIALMQEGSIDVTFITEETAQALGELSFTRCPGLLQNYAAIISQQSPLAASDGPLSMEDLEQAPLACVGENVFVPSFLEGTNVRSIPADKHAIANFCNGGGACICEEFYEINYPGLTMRPLAVPPSQIVCLHRPNPSPNVRRYLAVAAEEAE